MNKLLYLLLFIFTIGHASFIQKVEIIESSNQDLKIQDIKESMQFKKTKLPIIRHSDNDYFIKFTFDPSKLDHQTNILEFKNVFNLLEFEENLPISNLYKHPTLDISQKLFVETLYVKIHNGDGYVNFDLNIFEKDEYITKEILISKFMGITYGIIFAAFLYYFALYAFNRNQSYIYYSLTQLSMLLILIFVSTSEIQNNRIAMDIVFFSFFIFSNLFTQHFLNTKEKSPKIHLLLKIAIGIYIIDLLSGYIFDYYLFEENIPLSTLLLLYIIAALNIYKKGDIPTLFYLIGWSFVIFSFLFIEAQFYFTQEELLVKPLYLMHIATPIESLILAFALSYKMKLLELEKQEQQQFLTHQSKLASMGEMIGNIAHQWRQPLTHLSYIMMNLKTAHEKEKLTIEYFHKKSTEANQQLEFMSHTIDDFRDFFKMSKQKEIFSLNEAINEVINLLSASFNTHKINVNFIETQDIELNSLRGEFLQVLFNILNNAKDEFSRRETTMPKVSIDVKEENNQIFIKISDNAGGIDNEVINKIFEPYFTTKDKGLGIGLYMSKMIIDKNIGGNLDVSNIDNGAQFTIKLPILKNSKEAL